MMAGDNVKNKVLEVLGIILLILFLFPFFIVLINAAKPADQIIRAPLALPQKWGALFANMNRVIHSPNMNYWKSFFDSAIITVASLFTIVLFSSMAAWVLERNSIKHNNKKWANVIFYVLVASMVIPFQVVMLPVLSWYRSVGKFTGIGLLQSYKGSVFAYIGFGCAMSVFILHGFIKSIPLELEEAATIDGCTAEGVFGRIVLPLLQPNFERHLDLERLPFAVAPFGPSRKNPHAPDCRHGLCRKLCKAVGLDFDIDLARDAPGNHFVHLRAEVHHQRHGGRLNKINLSLTKKCRPCRAAFFSCRQRKKYVVK